MNYVVADNYLCFLALLEMILREKGARITQYDLAEMTSVVIPEGYSVRIKNVRYSTCQDDYGVSVTPPTLRKVFSELGISIDVLYLDALRINEFELDELLQEYLSQGKYVVFAFSYGVLYNKNPYFDLGHVSLLEQVINDDLIQVYDPGPDAPGKKNVRISDMYDAMRKKGGLYIFG